MSTTRRHRSGRLPLVLLAGFFVLAPAGGVTSAAMQPHGGGPVGGFAWGAHVGGSSVGRHGIGFGVPRVGRGGSCISGRRTAHHGRTHGRHDKGGFFPAFYGGYYYAAYVDEYDDDVNDEPDEEELRDPDDAPRRPRPSGTCEVSSRSYPQECVWEDAP